MTASDTPRTDKEQHHYGGDHWVPRDFARQLERELNEAKAEIERLKKYVQHKMPCRKSDWDFNELCTCGLDGRAVTSGSEFAPMTIEASTDEYLRGFRDAIERAAKEAETSTNSHFKSYKIARSIRAIEPGEGK